MCGSDSPATDKKLIQFRLCAFACLILLFAIRALVQSSTLPATTLVVGSAAGTLDLRGCFGLPSVSGQVAQFKTVMGRFNLKQEKKMKR